MDWKTEKALLEQKNELLELQIQELREREDAYKLFNETILNAYNSMQSDVNKQNSLVYKQLQSTLEQYSQELIESKNKNTNALIELDSQNRQLKAYLEQLEIRVQDQKIQQENELNDLEQQLSLLQQQQQQEVIVSKPKKKKQEDKENMKQEQGGCIVSIKPRNEEVKKLCYSKVLNCKDSNVLEISQLDWLDQSSPTGLFKQFQIHQRERDLSDHSQRTQHSQMSKRIFRDKRKSEDSVSPQLNRKNTSNYITPDTREIKYEVKSMITKLLAKDKSAESCYSKQEKRSLAEFTKQINSVRSTENFQMVLKQSQMLYQ